MTDDAPTLTRRRILSGLVTIGAASTAAGAGTMAALSDDGSAEDNVVGEGTLQLEFDGDATFGIGSTFEPGQSVEGSVTLVNPASMQGSLDVDVTYIENDAGSDDVNADAVARQMRVNKLEYAGKDYVSEVPNANGNSWVDLEDLANRDVSSGERTPNDLTDLPGPGSGTGTTFTVGLTYEDPGDNSYAEDGIDVQFHFDLNQDDRQ